MKPLSRLDKGLISIVLLAVSAVLGVVITARAAGFIAECARAEKLVGNAVAFSKSDANEAAKYSVALKEKADELKKKNLFSPPAKARNPVSQVTGILGSEALINGRWYKVGETIGEAKLVAIEPTRVRVEWEGRQSVFAPLSAVTSSDTEKPEGPSEESQIAEAAPSGDSGMDRESMRSRRQSMSEEERQMFRERMRSRRNSRGQESGSMDDNSSGGTKNSSNSDTGERTSKGGGRPKRGRGSSF
jgi:hypothetical protein